MSKSQEVSEQSLFCRVWAFPIGSQLDLVGSISEGGLGLDVPIAGTLKVVREMR